jgi:uncharacterized protein YneF (UPF0154 family)
MLKTIGIVVLLVMFSFLLGLIVGIFISGINK